MAQMVVLYTGRQGPPGPERKGPPGPLGPGFRAKGDWSPGETYGPGDAVSADSSTVAGVRSLFVQRHDSPEAVSTAPPRDASGRWTEIGINDLTNFTGAIWRVYQIAHTFTEVGTPIGFSIPGDRWVPASSRVDQEVAVGVVREVISDDEFIVQTNGEITGLSPAVIDPAGATEFETGRFYYASKLRGRLSLAPPSDIGNFSSNAMLLATGPTSGVVLQWQQTPNIVGRRAVGLKSFYYDATPGQDIFSGEDLDGNILGYEPSDQIEVFVDGVLLSSFEQVTAADGTTVEIVPPLIGGERVVIRAPSEPLPAIVPAVAVMADSVAGSFDGSETRFPLLAAGQPVPLPQPQNVMVVLDGIVQEPGVDYDMVEGLTTDTDIVFSEPPAQGTRFWAAIGTALGNIAFLDVQVLVAQQATIDNINFTSLVIDEGEF